MRKGWIYGALLTAALLIPRNDVELAKIKPVEVVSIRFRDDVLMVETDTEDVGVGLTVEDAIKDMEETAAGRIYLDTAKYLLVEENATSEIPEMCGLLKGSVLVCERKGDLDLRAAGEYLGVHTPKMKLKSWEKGKRLQILESENDRMKLK